METPEPLNLTENEREIIITPNVSCENTGELFAGNSMKIFLSILHRQRTEFARITPALIAVNYNLFMRVLNIWLATKTRYIEEARGKGNGFWKEFEKAERVELLLRNVANVARKIDTERRLPLQEVMCRIWGQDFTINETNYVIFDDHTFENGCLKGTGKMLGKVHPASLGTLENLTEGDMQTLEARFGYAGIAVQSVNLLKALTVGEKPTLRQLIEQAKREIKEAAGVEEEMEEEGDSDEE
ncbi:hypothetical protein HZA42_04770 [Candidatus Peregrinibacteria bacterium]|nr:hypothetical protein [Candidatus Peregrinibacteria bacterium]